MWESGNNYVFYDIFIDTTKHLEMLFEAFPETQPNISKYFSFQVDDKYFWLSKQMEPKYHYK